MPILKPSRESRPRATVVWQQIKRIPLYGAVVAFALVACAMVVSVDAWRTFHSRALVIEGDYAETANLARSLAEQAQDTMEFADSLGFQLRQRVEADGWSAEPIAKLQQSAAAAVTIVPQVHGLFLYNREGHWVVNSLGSPVGSLDNASAAYFQYHRDHTDRGVHVGEFLQCIVRSDCHWVIPISRRVDGPDGQFAGIVLATVSVDKLVAFYKTFDVPKQGMIGLLTSDGIIAVRNPDTHAPTGTDTSKGSIFTTLLPKSPVGSFTEDFPIDGIRRLGSYHRVEGFPFVVVVAHSESEVLADWRRDAILHFLISLAIGLGLVFCCVLFARQIKRQDEIEQRFRLLSDNSSDAIVSLDLDGRRRYVSPAFHTLTGWGVDEGTGLAPGAMIHPDDQALVTRDMDALRRGELDEVTHRFRYICKDGSHLWVEGRVRFVAAEGSQPAQMVANVRDISANKVAEEHIFALNQKLMWQALTDGLTGLANRRHFDEALAIEWRRIGREQQPISLVIIDLDRFKSYNDRYGHLQGDNALQAVASELAGFVRRPGDVVARYGGEEMVLLLPGAPADGAVSTASAIRAGIEALGLEHLGNPPHGVMTASVGVATVWPGTLEAESGPDVLIHMADKALYKAKSTGRNRTVLASAAAEEIHIANVVIERTDIVLYAIE